MYPPALLIASMMLMAPALATPVNVGIEERQTITPGIISYIGFILKGTLFNGNKLACDGDFASGQQYYFATGTGANGQFFTSCWLNDTDTEPWDQTTANVANCLTNLHYTQADTCISVSGSSCDNGYIAGGGRLQNLRVPIYGSGTQGAAQLSADESATLQAGFNAMIGQNVRGTGTYGPYVYATTGNGNDDLTSDAAQMQVNWIGEQAC